MDESWYVVLCKSKQEKRAQEHLSNQGGRVFLPTITVEKINKGQRQQVTEPLFPGYLFLQCASDSPLLGTLRSTRGVRGLLRFGEKVVKVAPLLIGDLQQKCENVDNLSSYEAGQPIEFTDGPFKHYHGIFHEYDGDKRAIVLIDVLSRQHAIVVDLENIIGQP